MGPISLVSLPFPPSSHTPEKPSTPVCSLLVLDPCVPSFWKPSLPFGQLPKPEISLSSHTWLPSTA